MKKLFTLFMASIFMLAFTSCDFDFNEAEQFLYDASMENTSDALDEFDEVYENFETYSTEDQNNVLAGVASLMAQVKNGSDTQKTLEEAFVEMYSYLEEKGALDSEAKSMRHIYVACSNGTYGSCGDNGSCGDCYDDDECGGCEDDDECDGSGDCTGGGNRTRVDRTNTTRTDGNADDFYGGATDDDDVENNNVAPGE